jgi:hypothetical protein
MRNRRLQRLPKKPAVIERRVPEITTKYGNRAPEVPQSYFDFITSDEDSCCGASLVLGPYTHVAVADGLWSNPATWNTGTVPGVNAIVDIGSRTVTYDVESDVKIKDIHIDGPGALKWSTNKDTRLWVDTIMCHGTLTMGEAGDAIGESSTFGKPRAEIVFHRTQAPLTTVRLGLNTMGAVRIHGAEKADRLFGRTDFRAGQTQFRVERLSTAKWRKGDKVLFVATDNAGTSPTDAQYTGPTQFYGPFIGVQGIRTRTLGYRLSQDEVRTIVSISGDVLTIDAPLAYDHVVTRETLPRGQYVEVKPAIASLSRSIRFRSESTETLQHRAHLMFMHHDDIDCRYAETMNMGRTDTDPSLVRPEGTLAYASNGGTVITNPNNVRGRYSWHIHWTGPHFGRRQVIFKGLVAWAPSDEKPIPGWAFTHHASRASIENCVAYNVRGAGIVSELGNEIGQWINNTVAWCRGDGFDLSWASRAEQWTNHNGHAGIAYENQARNILQHGNIASSSHLAWMFMQQDTTQLLRIPDKYSLRFYDSLTQGAGTLTGVFNEDEDTYGIEQAQIPDFDDNVAFGCGRYFAVAHRQFTDRADNTPMISRRCHAIKCNQVFQLINYTFNYSFYDALWTGVGSGVAASQGNVSWAINFGNIKIKDFATGFQQLGGGFNYNGYWMDILFENVATEFTDFTASWDITGWQAANPGKTFPQDHALYNLMGPWTTTSSTPGVAWAGTLRDWKSYTIADFPDPYPAAPRGPGGVEPLPGTPKPYFWLDPTSTTTVSGINSVSLRGVIVDTLGVRFWPDWFSSESFSPTTTSTRPVKRNENATALDLVLRNGCFQDGGVWKTRCWFIDTDRWTGDYIQFFVDLTVSGVAEDILLANVVEPAAPTLPLVPESAGQMRKLVIPATPPTIVTASDFIVEENRQLAVTLRANDGAIQWSISGGADSAHFEIATVGGMPTLRWAGNGFKDFELPTDAGANNTYSVQVAATNRYGVAASKTLTVTVRDKTESVVTPFSDDFNRAAEILEASPNWLRVDGEEGQAVINANRLRIVLPQVDGTRATYLSPDTGSTNLYAQATFVGTTGDGLIGVSITDSNNLISSARVGSNVNLASRKDGVSTVLGTWPAAGSTIRLEYVDGVATVKVNGSVVGTATIPDPPPATSRAGIVAILGTGDLLDNFSSGAM